MLISHCILKSALLLRIRCTYEGGPLRFSFSQDPNWQARCCMDCGTTPGSHVGAHVHSGAVLAEHHAPYQVRFSSLPQLTIELGRGHSSPCQDTRTDCTRPCSSPKHQNHAPNNASHQSSPWVLKYACAYSFGSYKRATGNICLED